MNVQEKFDVFRAVVLKVMGGALFFTGIGFGAYHRISYGTWLVSPWPFIFVAGVGVVTFYMPRFVKN